MEHSEKLSTFAPAFVLAQAKIKAAEKDGVNKFFDNRRYAGLSSVMDACKEALNSEGIAVLQTPAPSEAGKLALATVLMHKSGEWVSGTVTVPLAKADPQGYGSAMTYARRYSLAAMVGVCPEDDDGEGAVGRGTNGQRQQATQRQPQRSAPPRNINQTTGELTERGPHSEETVPADVTSFGEYGDLMDDDRFEEAVMNELKRRSFTDNDCREAKAQACRMKNVAGLGAFPMKSRHEFLTAIRAGFMDQYKQQPTEPKQTTRRPARAAAGK
jgi:hypothetical protein